MAARPPRDRSKRPAREPDSAPGVIECLDQDLRALVGLLARQAARECFEQETAASRDDHFTGGH
jgi:hypothetical protein